MSASGSKNGSFSHGKHDTLIYGSWAAMLSRCRNPNNHAFARYGGRGIRVCERWLEFAAFYADMGDRPKGKSLDRWPDNDGEYGPNNCRWATTSEQSRNRRNVRKISANGLELGLQDWADRTGIPARTLWKRLKDGWDPVAAVTLPKVTTRAGVKRGAHVYPGAFKEAWKAEQGIGE